MKGAILRLGLYSYRFFRSWCAGGDMVMVQKACAIVKPYNGEQSRGASQTWGVGPVWREINASGGWNCLPAFGETQGRH